MGACHNDTHTHENVNFSIPIWLNPNVNNLQIIRAWKILGNSLRKAICGRTSNDIYLIFITFSDQN